MNNKKILNISLATLSLLAFIPIGFYGWKFGIGLWETNEEWANLGSFFGGVLGPIFTLISVLLLMATLYETKNANAQQLHLLKEQHFDEMFFIIMNNITASLNGSKYALIERIGDKTNTFFSEANIWVVENFKIGHQTDLNEDAWNTAYDFMRKHRGLLDSEIRLLWPLLCKLKDMDSVKIEHYLNLIKGLISNEHRFWLEAYGRVWSIEFKYTIKGIVFADLPDLISDKVSVMEGP